MPVALGVTIAALVLAVPLVMAWASSSGRFDDWNRDKPVEESWLHRWRFLFGAVAGTAFISTAVAAYPRDRALAIVQVVNAVLWGTYPWWFLRLLRRGQRSEAATDDSDGRQA